MYYVCERAEILGALFRAIEPRYRFISNRIVRHGRRFGPAPGINLIKQHLDGILGGHDNLQSLSRSTVSAIEQLADCRNADTLVLRFQRQTCEFGNDRRSMLTR